MLLAFSVANYRCFAEEATLDLTRGALRTLTPRAGSSWEESTWRTAAIYGANASGKSTLISAISHLRHAIKGERGLLHQPHLLDGESAALPTRYHVDFIHEGIRYAYSVEAQPWGIAREELWEAGFRWRKLFIRTQGEQDKEPTIDAGSSLTGPTAEVRRITTTEDLFLAVALRYGHASLAPVARGLRAFRFIRHDDEERAARLQWMMAQLANTPAQWTEISDAIAHTADLGITRVELEERDLPPEFLDSLRRFLRSVHEQEEDAIPDDLLAALKRSLVFYHRGTDGQERRLPLGAQSQGTVTWLATVGPALDAMRQGQTLFVDELDASLHPTLSATLVELFKDPDLNRTGAQLVFTTHDTSLLDNSPTQLLDSGEVWMCEKSSDGRSELFSLADFTSTRKGTNKQRRYLVGAFGAIPTVDASKIRQLLATDHEAA
ncbi:ATP/GTP-binding protein [Actinomyces slackii]|uniref:Predicted ATPase n=1 Tax=Actinomyces slackii TaxID=52774 RepID=A0A3S4SJJ6_9ACTO|nr:ATP-binding protein [Actinomyces slackii]VEG74168.1 Predicted ATPase [Actinomyces slackii]